MARSDRKEKRYSAKTLMAVVCICILMCGAVGGTVAWLIAETDPVVNTFTYGDINLKLEETDTNKDGDNNPNTNTYPMKPGATIEKDPKVTVVENSEAAWLFVKLEEKGGNVTADGTTYSFDNYLSYELAAGWTELDSVKYPGIYYRAVEQSASAQVFDVLKDNQIKVLDTVTKEMLNTLDKNDKGETVAEADRKYPVLEVTAYAVQRDNLINTAVLAWEKVVPPAANNK